MSVSLFLARRLSLSSGRRKSSPAIRVSVAAVALSVAVMLASLAVVIGFKREIKGKITGFNSHISLYDLPTESGGDNLVTLTPSLTAMLDELPFVTDYSLEVSIPAILKTSSDFKGVYLRSLNGESTRQFILSNLEEGKMPDYSQPESEKKIVISRRAASQLGLKTGDKIDTYFISDDVRVRRLEIVGIYNSHFDSYDQVLIYGALPLIQGVAGISKAQGTSIQVQTDDFERVDEYADELQTVLAMGVADGRLFRYYRVDTARNQGAGYFHWLALLDTNVAVVLALMTIVAVATLISGMLILILDKKRFIGVTRAMGASVADVRRVFVYLALKVAMWGMLIGNIVMIALLYCQDRTHFLPLDPEAYYIDFVPVEIDWTAIVIMNAVCLVVIYLSLILPSRFVARISPAEAMRSE